MVKLKTKAEELEELKAMYKAQMTEVLNFNFTEGIELAKDFEARVRNLFEDGCV